ncbi:MAG: DoxX family protein [Planctomycetes bacterium]|nr:DoxX family protein [Planctomycetota bacterium]
MVTPRGFRGWLRDAALPLLVARLVVGGVYVWYGVNKVREPVAFLKALHGYGILPVEPPHPLNLTVVVLPWIEILCGALLLAGAWLRAAGVLLCAMTVVFTVAVALHASGLAAAQGLSLCAVRFDCGCGIGEVWVCPKLAENLALIALAGVAAGSRSRRWTLEGLRTAAPSGSAGR